MNIQLKPPTAPDSNNFSQPLPPLLACPMSLPDMTPKDTLSAEIKTGPSNHVGVISDQSNASPQLSSKEPLETPPSPEGPALPPGFLLQDACPEFIEVEAIEDNSNSQEFKKRKHESISDYQKGKNYVHKKSKVDKNILKHHSTYKPYSFAKYSRKLNSYNIHLKHYKSIKNLKHDKSNNQSESSNVKMSLNGGSDLKELQMNKNENILDLKLQASEKLVLKHEVLKSDEKKETNSKSSENLCSSHVSEGKLKEKERKKSHKSPKKSKKHKKASKVSASSLKTSKVPGSHSKSKNHHKHSRHSPSKKADKSSQKSSSDKNRSKISRHIIKMKNSSPHKNLNERSLERKGSKTRNKNSNHSPLSLKSPNGSSHHYNIPLENLLNERCSMNRMSQKDCPLSPSINTHSKSERSASHSKSTCRHDKKKHVHENRKSNKGTHKTLKRARSSSESKSNDRKKRHDNKRQASRHHQSPFRSSSLCKETDALNRSSRSKSKAKTSFPKKEVSLDHKQKSLSYQTPEKKSKRSPIKPKGGFTSTFKGFKGFGKNHFRGFGFRSSHFRHRHRVKGRDDEVTPDLSTHASKWIKSTPAELYYSRMDAEAKEVVASDLLKELHNKFKTELIERADRARALKPKYEPPVRKTKLRKHKPVEEKSGSDSSSSDLESSSDDEDTSMEELEKKRQHPDRLHPELWYNDPKEMNDGPLCRCSAKARRSGIRHGIYMGENHQPLCDPHSNNAKKLHHYKIAMTPVTNFLTKNPTIIEQNGDKYIFEGFSLFSHKRLPKLPNCKVIRFNYEYTILYVEEEMPQNFTVAGLELFQQFLLREILELVDLDWRAHDDPDGCPKFHFMPRFAKTTKNDGKELLSLNYVLEYLLQSNKTLIEESNIPQLPSYSTQEWQDLADEVKGMIVTCPGMKPSSVRVDQLDREHTDENLDTTYPIIVHFGVRPPQLSYAGNPLYQKAWRDYVKYRHLLANKPKVCHLDRHKLGQKEFKLQEMRMENDLKRDVTVVISSKGFYRTGIMSDIVQHVMLLPVLVCHLRFHDSLQNLEEEIRYKFGDRFLLQLALTHPSYRENFGTNPDHARNSLTNCGLRQPQYGDRRIHYMNTRKRGINTLINIMSRFGSQCEATSNINHNERLEFLGDAVVEFLSSIHLFYMFPDLEEGGLATYRAAIVQNQHLAVLAKKLHLEKFMLYAHGSDLCHDLELRHAMANCFEALMGALFLDYGIEIADKVFSVTLFPEPELQEVWKNYPLHPLQEQEPEGDRKWIDSVPLLQKLLKFEEQIGIEFNHIRLLARALTHRSLGYNNLTLGSNQRLEFLGDTVLQLVASEYLYKYFPQHHEGHLSLLRSSLVNNRTQAVVCGDLGMVDYAIYPYDKVELKPKDKADLLEAFLGALYVDKDLGYCRKFCEVCFFPRLQDFIMNQDWNDPKSKLQQCCLTLRSMDGGEPDIPTYKVIECKGPTNTRVYAVAVYFQGKRLAVGSGHSIQQAEMDAAMNALEKSKDLFPQLKHQKRAIERSLKQGKPYKLARRIKSLEHKKGVDRRRGNEQIPKQKI